MSKENTEESLFDVVFDGRPLPGIPLEKASNGLAGLLRKQPDDIAHLFNERPMVLKRNVSDFRTGVWRYDNPSWARFKDEYGPNITFDKS